MNNYHTNYNHRTYSKPIISYSDTYPTSCDKELRILGQCIGQYIEYNETRIEYNETRNLATQTTSCDKEFQILGQYIEHNEARNQAEIAQNRSDKNSLETISSQLNTINTTVTRNPPNSFREWDSILDEIQTIKTKLNNTNPQAPELQEFKKTLYTFIQPIEIKIAEDYQRFAQLKIAQEKKSLELLTPSPQNQQKRLVQSYETNQQIVNRSMTVLEVNKKHIFLLEELPQTLNNITRRINETGDSFSKLNFNSHYRTSYTVGLPLILSNITEIKNLIQSTRSHLISLQSDSSPEFNRQANDNIQELDMLFTEICDIETAALGKSGYNTSANSRHQELYTSSERTPYTKNEPVRGFLNQNANLYSQSFSNAAHSTLNTPSLNQLDNVLDLEEAATSALEEARAEILDTNEAIQFIEDSINYPDRINQLLVLIQDLNLQLQVRKASLTKQKMPLHLSQKALETLEALKLQLQRIKHLEGRIQGNQTANLSPQRAPATKTQAFNTPSSNEVKVQLALQEAFTAISTADEEIARIKELIKEPNKTEGLHELVQASKMHLEAKKNDLTKQEIPSSSLRDTKKTLEKLDSKLKFMEGLERLIHAKKMTSETKHDIEEMEAILKKEADQILHCNCKLDKLLQSIEDTKKSIQSMTEDLTKNATESSGAFYNSSVEDKEEEFKLFYQRLEVIQGTALQIIQNKAASVQKKDSFAQTEEEVLDAPFISSTSSSEKTALAPFESDSNHRGTSTPPYNDLNNQPPSTAYVLEEGDIQNATSPIQHVVSNLSISTLNSDQEEDPTANHLMNLRRKISDMAMADNLAAQERQVEQLEYLQQFHIARIDQLTNENRLLKEHIEESNSSTSTKKKPISTPEPEKFTPGKNLSETRHNPSCVACQQTALKAGRCSKTMMRIISENQKQQPYKGTSIQPMSGGAWNSSHTATPNEVAQINHEQIKLLPVEAADYSV